MGMALSPYCHFERKREIFFVRGQAKDVRIAASGKHRAPSESEGRCFMQTALRKKTETGNEKDPSAALGMTKRGNASFHSFSTCCGSQPRLAALGSPFQGKGLAWTLPPSYGRRCPEGAEVGWESGMKKSGGDRLKCVVNESTRAPLFPTQTLPLGKADDTRIASAHKAFRHRALYIRGEAATFIPLPYSSRAFIGHLGTARPMSYPSNPFSDIKEKNLCV